MKHNRWKDRASIVLPRKSNAPCVRRSRFKKRNPPTDYRISKCRLANAEHERSKRQYAHTFDDTKTFGTICVAKAFWDLPDEHMYAILLHEIGHFEAGYEGSEQAANRAIENLTGIKIHYVDSPHGKSLEWITPEDTNTVKGILKIRTVAA